MRYYNRSIRYPQAEQVKVAVYTDKMSAPAQQPFWPIAVTLSTAGLLIYLTLGV